MIDLHCHVLPGLDDGPADMADSVAMAWQARADGVREICATPHIRHDHDVRIHELPQRVRELQDEIDRAGAGVRIRTGGEVAETILDHLDDDELRDVSLGGGGRWILLEPRPGPLTDDLDDAVVSLQRRGFRALIAHPERHLGRDIFQRLGRLVRAGALVQVTAATMLHEPAATGMRALAEAGVVHVLGSDAHSARWGREAVLGDALGALGGVASLVPHLHWIRAAAPEAILAGLDLEAPYSPAGPAS